MLERLVAIVLLVAIIGGLFVAAYRLLRGSVEQFKVAAIFLDEHWKAAIFLVVPLFIRPTLLFLERVQKAFGMETSPVETEPAEPVQNPETPKVEDLESTKAG